MRGMRNRKLSGTIGVMIALAISLMIVLAGTYLLTELMLKERVRGEHIKYLVPLVLMAATLISGKVNCVLLSKREPYISLIPTGILVILLLIISLLIEGTYEMLGKNLVGIGVGALGSCIFCMKKTGKKGMRKSVYR